VFRPEHCSRSRRFGASHSGSKHGPCWMEHIAVWFCVWTDLGSSSASSQQPDRKRTSAAPPKPLCHCGARWPNFFAQREMPQVGTGTRRRSCTGSLYGSVRPQERKKNISPRKILLPQFTCCFGFSIYARLRKAKTTYKI
jgi:hypothetical protein